MSGFLMATSLLIVLARLIATARATGAEIGFVESDSIHSGRTSASAR